MSRLNIWIIRATLARLRQPEMKRARRFMMIAAALFALFLGWSFRHLAGQSTEQQMENAAVGVFAAMGVLTVVVMIGAVAVRRKN